MLDRLISKRSSEGQREIEEAKRKRNVLSQIRSHFWLITISSNDYKNAVRGITNPIGSNDNEYGAEFTFKDMKDLFKPSLSLKHDSRNPAVYYFYLYSEKLAVQLKSLITSVDLSEHQDLERACVNFCVAADSFDFKDAMLSAPKFRAGQKSMVQVHEEMLENLEEDATFRQGNARNMFIALKVQIGLQANALNTIASEYAKIFPAESDVSATQIKNV